MIPAERCPVCSRSTVVNGFCSGCGAVLEEQGNDGPAKPSGLGEAWLVENIRFHVHEMKLNRVITAVGPPGTGKSWTGLRIGELVDGGFSINRVVFPGIEYIRAVGDPDLGIGSFVEWDDAGLGAPAREFWSLLNRGIGMVAQSSRFRRLVLWVTLPDKSFLDAQPRKLTDIHLEFMKRKSPKESIAARVYEVETNPKSGKIYYKHPRFDSADGPKALDIIRFRNPPSDHLTELYEDRKARYMMAFYKGLVDQLEGGGIAMDDYRARMLLLMVKYGIQTGRTKTQIARELRIQRESLHRAIATARKMTGWQDDAPEPSP